MFCTIPPFPRPDTVCAALVSRSALEQPGRIQTDIAGFFHSGFPEIALFQRNPDPFKHFLPLFSVSFPNPFQLFLSVNRQKNAQVIASAQSRMTGIGTLDDRHFFRRNYYLGQKTDRVRVIGAIGECLSCEHWLQHLCFKPLIVHISTRLPQALGRALMG